MTSRSKPSQNQTAKQNLQELSAQKDHLITGLQKKNLELTNSYRHATRQIQELIDENHKLRQELFAAKSSYSILSRDHEETNRQYAEIIQQLKGSAPYFVKYFNNILKHCNSHNENNKSAILSANTSKTENTTLKALTQTVKPHTVNGTVLNLNPTISLARSALVPNISNNCISTTTGNNNEAESPLRSINSQPNSIVSGYQNENEENEEPVFNLEQDETVISVLATSLIRKELSTILESSVESSSPEQQLKTNSIITIRLKRLSIEEIRAHSRSSLNESLSEISTLVNASSTTGLDQLDLSEAETAKTVVVNQDIKSRVPTSPQYTSTPNVTTSQIMIPHMSALGDRTDVSTHPSSATTSPVESPKSSCCITKRKNFTNRHEEDSSDDPNQNLPVTELPRKKYKRIRTTSLNSEMSEEEEETDARKYNRPRRAARPKSLKEENLKTKMRRNK